MIHFIREYIREHVHEADVQMDSWGNLYIRKCADSSLFTLHSSLPTGYPTLACHLDQVQELHSEDFEVRQDGDRLYGWSEQNQRQEGLGADDKNGIWVCLRCLEECPCLKVFMAVGEEKGCIGSNHADMSFFADSLYVLEPDCKAISNHADMSFFADSLYVLEPDCKGGEEIHTNLKDTPCASPEFEQALLEANSQLSILNCQFTITPGKGSDIFALTLSGIGVSCANIPCGYHLPHKDDEYTVIAELEHSLAYIRHFITTEHRRFPHMYKTDTQKMIKEQRETV